MKTHRLLKTIGDETRMRILILLLDNELNVTELEAVLSTSQSNVSRHLAKLLAADLVTFRRAQHNVYYRINPTQLDHLPFLRLLLNDEKNQPQWAADSMKLTDLKSLSAPASQYSSEVYSDDHLI